MNLTLRAALRAAKPFIGLWLTAAVFVFVAVAVDTRGFTKSPSWWAESAIHPTHYQASKGPTHD